LRNQRSRARSRGGLTAHPRRPRGRGREGNRGGAPLHGGAWDSTGVADVTTGPGLSGSGTFSELLGEITSCGGSENQPNGWSAAPGGPVKLSLDRAGNITPSFYTKPSPALLHATLSSRGILTGSPGPFVTVVCSGGLPSQGGKKDALRTDRCGTCCPAHNLAGFGRTAANLLKAIRGILRGVPAPNVV
jgi:hypothetical protein